MGMVAAGVDARVAVGAVEGHVEEVGDFGVGNCCDSHAMLLEHHHHPLFDLLHLGGSMLWLPSTALFFPLAFSRFLNWLSLSLSFTICALAYLPSITECSQRHA